MRAAGGNDGDMESLTELHERRVFECHLAPDLALRTLEEADAFLRDRGLLTRTADCALPSLYEACHEDPYKPGSPGFVAWAGDDMAMVWQARRPWLPHRRGSPRQEPARDRRGGAPARPGLPRGDRAHARCRPRLAPAARPLERCGAIISRSLQVTPARDTTIRVSWSAGTRPIR